MKNERKEVKKRRITLERAITMFCSNYGKALTSTYVRKPIAWALYETWKVVDREEKERYLKGGRME